MTKRLSISSALLGALASAAAAAAPSNDLVSNGGFESGDTTGWDSAPSTTSTFGAVGTANTGSFAGEIVNADLGEAAVISQSGLGAGAIGPGDVIQISFAVQGSIPMDGAVFVNMISEDGSGQASSSQLLTGGPFPVSADYTTFRFTSFAGPDVTNGLTLQVGVVNGTTAGDIATLLIDDLTITIRELTSNNGFELGDTSGWDSAPTANSTFDVTSDANSGSFAGEIFNDDLATAAIVSQSGLGAGAIEPGEMIQVSFSAKADSAVGGVAFANIITVDSMGQSSASVLLSNGPLPLTSAWQDFDFMVPAGADASGGVILQFAAVTGAATGSVAHVFIDDVSVEGTSGSAQNFCVASPNSAGTGATMGFSGSLSIANDDFVIEAYRLPAGQFCLFWIGQGFNLDPSFDGFLCIGAPCRLLPVAQADGMGFASLALPQSAYAPNGCAPPVAGGTYTYQVAYRDTVGSGVNWSDALSVVFGL